MNGIVNVYKPEGITSFDVVRKIRNITRIKKVGHTGTLDPMACGVLPVCIGKATKIVDYIMNDYKIYKTQLKLGVVTDTYDREGKIISTSEVNISETDLKNTINSFKGEISQIPPMYSAIKVQGKRLYELARQGIEIERQARNITLHEINILDINLPYVTFEVKCSKGTYIRSLCYDIGTKLNCGGTMWYLERTESGNFKKNDSIKLEDITEDNINDFLIPLDEALDKYKKINVTSKVAKLLINGVEIQNQNLLKKFELNKMYRFYTEDEKFIGIGMRKDTGLKIKKLLL
ncbi:tRNA pseudouridine(55) synthase TruB [Clostridium aestuarii]|uniref:tRNA pseudouridine synthase B n=1 Tax=Clostridium aestuarii TaxID=338193 RepID=A0ABT4CY60_9CLOT|nr:tRNA pseudouridine(55) synthase TruB [Clostridium aestuarii]MCY6483928.1 tRNA pseudouridine(55) synthase TruB [Clostridium aestuarii]